MFDIIIAFFWFKNDENCRKQKRTNLQILFYKQNQINDSASMIPASKGSNRLCISRPPHATGLLKVARRGSTAEKCTYLGPDYQNACKVTMFSTLYLELQHESYNMPAML